MSEIEAAIERLGEVLPSRAPWLEAAWLPPVADEDLRLLREAVAPFELPEELAVFLRWHDGQDEAGWWPGFLGRLPFDPAARLVSHFRDRQELAREDADDATFLPSLLPLTWHSWSVRSLELAAGVKRAIVDETLDNTDFSIQYPSLAALLDVVADMAESDLLRVQVGNDEWPDFFRLAAPIFFECVQRHAHDSWAFEQPALNPADLRPHGVQPRYSRSDSAAWPSHWLQQAGPSPA